MSVLKAYVLGFLEISTTSAQGENYIETDSEEWLSNKKNFFSLCEKWPEFIDMAAAQFIFEVSGPDISST